MLSRSSDPIDRALRQGVANILAALDAVSLSAPVVLIDGRSGAGKSSLSRRLAEEWPHGEIQTLALDSVYPGWDGLARGVEHVERSVLEPLRRGDDGSWQGWDWEADQYAEHHIVRASVSTIIEGSGLLTPRTALLGDLRVWVDADDDDRKDRALHRDGEAYAPHWDRWAAQEDEHIALHQPRRLADLIVTIPAGFSR